MPEMVKTYIDNQSIFVQNAFLSFYTHILWVDPWDTQYII